MPPTHDQHPRNNYVSEALNYYVRTLLEPLRVNVVPTTTIGLVWGENLGAMKTHLMNIKANKVVPLPIGKVVSHALVYPACSGYV